MSCFEQCHFRLDPRVLGGVFDVHRSAEGYDAIDVVQVRRERVASVEVDDAQAMAVVLQGDAQGSRGLGLGVLKDEQAHGTKLPSYGPALRVCVGTGEVKSMVAPGPRVKSTAG